MHHIYREGPHDSIIRGVALPAFIHNGSTYHQIWVKIYEDSLIDAWGLMDLNAFRTLITSKKLVTQLPKHADISCTDLYKGRATLSTWVEEDAFLCEVEDTLRTLQGHPSASDLCRLHFVAYLIHPNEERRQDLRNAYHNVPKHNRVFILKSMDDKDSDLIRCTGNTSPTPRECMRLRTYYTGFGWWNTIERTLLNTHQLPPPHTTTHHTCRRAFVAYLLAPHDAHHRALQSAYQAVPEEERTYILYDATMRDTALQRCTEQPPPPMHLLQRLLSQYSEFTWFQWIREQSDFS